MLIKVEPAGFFMFVVQFCFDLEQPDLEDQEVRDYLSQQDLEPRYGWEAEFEGRSCQWMQFGGCYLGGHFQEIGLLQRRAVEVELLYEEVGRAVEGIDGLSDAESESILASLVVEFKCESSFRIDENGELVVVLDEVDLDEALERLLVS